MLTFQGLCLVFVIKCLYLVIVSKGLCLVFVIKGLYLVIVSEGLCLVIVKEGLVVWLTGLINFPRPFISIN